MPKQAFPPELQMLWDENATNNFCICGCEKPRVKGYSVEYDHPDTGVAKCLGYHSKGCKRRAHIRWPILEECQVKYFRL
jgi:hypothetical protein